MNGFFWSYRVGPHAASASDIQLCADTNLYPHLTRWEFMGPAWMGFVREDPVLPPRSVCYDLSTALAVMRDQVVGKTGSRVIDLMEAESSFREMILGVTIGPTTPWFWSPHGTWEEVVRHFVSDESNFHFRESASP